MLICILTKNVIIFFSSRRRHTRFDCDWSSDVCSSDLDRGADRLAVVADDAQIVALEPQRPDLRGNRRRVRIPDLARSRDRKSTRLNSSHSQISYAVFCLKKKNTTTQCNAAARTVASPS